MKERRIIDFHAHILPGADHGSDGIKTTKAQLSALYDKGVLQVVATPHFYPQRDSAESFLKRREESVKAFLQLDCKERPHVAVGAEVLVCSGLDHMPGLSELCIVGTDVLLLEMPYTAWRIEHIEAVKKISRQGYTVVMAHIDRYPLESVMSLASQCDVLYQINASALKRIGGKRRVLELCEELCVAAIGSDIHGRDNRAASRLSRLNAYLFRCGKCVFEESEGLLKNARLI